MLNGSTSTNATRERTFSFTLSRRPVMNAQLDTPVRTPRANTLVHSEARERSVGICSLMSEMVSLVLT
ncbi:hypothetical protein NY2A_b093R [Paramecium bursaria Chlorella virus NY2A]|uniref:Uncharacterized protein b093R n=1 Tax=Paramecium bursaria Chlorella virus NY2A TaxID=46021 RepID=A7IVW8_PBCVN|nr:hypothetical protein NY2A_b093R [Paramecium bursaria Chlorella virus NY2A]YP_001498162.1 hypothetical protein AR158_c080R [Paramecium bursaria Chlorella virus AR158]ABT14492.1 hypothetical protein NY2A_b093R [Paramecium bursaria Chlorella virus NY2A]ABU43626.1 hypothetical protein AR158_c080R [Paramecium bursaria Chlorella virus AR158]